MKGSQRIAVLVGLFLLPVSVAVGDFTGEHTNTFSFTKRHRQILTEIRIAWDPAENGAPTVHPLAPFGSEDVLGDIARITGLIPASPKNIWSIFAIFPSAHSPLTPPVKAESERLFQELFPALEILLQNGRLQPGKYQLVVREPSTVADGVMQIDFFESERTKSLVLMDAPRPSSGDTFVLTEEHQKVLRFAASLMRGNSRRAKGEERYLDVPALDPKRPYGNMTYYPLDMAKHLGVTVDNKDYENSEDPPFAIKKLEKLVKLHLEMSQVLVLYVAEAQVDIGKYVRRDGVWEKAK